MCHGSGLSCLNVLLRPAPLPTSFLQLRTSRLPDKIIFVRELLRSFCQAKQQLSLSCCCRCCCCCVAAYVLLLCCSCCSCCCCSLTALKCARIKIKLPAIKAEKVNTLPRPVQPLRRVLLGQKKVVSARYSYINCTICHTSAWRHSATLPG